MALENITARRHYEQLKIYINDVLHLQVKLLDMVSFQSWIHGRSEFFIEYTFTGGTKITSAYSERTRWEAIIKILDTELSGS